MSVEHRNVIGSQEFFLGKFAPIKEKVLIKYENLKKTWKQQIPPIRKNNIQFSGFKNLEAFQHCYIWWKPRAQMNKLWRQFLLSTTSPLHMPPLPRKNQLTKMTIAWLII